MTNALRLLGLIGLLVVSPVLLSAADTNGLPPEVSSLTNLIDPELVDGNPQVKQLMKELEKDGIKAESLLDEHFLFASLIWGAVGGGYLLYARRQRMIAPFLGGVAMIGASFMIVSWLWMSLVCVALMVAVRQLVKREG